MLTTTLVVTGALALAALLSQLATRNEDAAVAPVVVDEREVLVRDERRA